MPNFRIIRSLHQCLVAASLSAAVTLGAAPVTFQLDLGPQIAGSNFDSAVDTAEVRGSFNGWSEGITLTATEADPELFTGTIETDAGAGTVLQYKFVLNKGGVLTWENDGLGPEGRQNREVTLTGSEQLVPLSTFNNVAVPPSNVTVTFQVNMDVQEAIGTFDPQSHSVEVRGAFNNWSPGFLLTPSEGNPDIYIGSTEIFGSPGATFEYKYVINQNGTDVWEGNVGPGGFGNRRLVLEQGTQSLPVVYFDNANNPPAGDVLVTFVVDLSVQEALGTFNPDFDTVNVAGQFNNWNTTDLQLTNTTENPLIFRGSTIVRGSIGATVPYKFLINGSTWESGDNRTFALQSGPLALPAAFFSNQAGLGNLAISREADNQVRLSWSAGPNVKLESSSTITGPWQEVADTLSLDSITLPIEPGSRFFRLAAE